MRRCRVCNGAVHLTAANHRGADVIPDIAYLVHFTCPACTAGLAVVLWEAPELDLLVDDTEPLFSAERDTREDDAA